MVVCCVIGCKNHTKYCYYATDVITFHRFPKDHENRKKWISATGKPNWKPTTSSRICSKHFKDEYFVTIDNVRTLVKNAIPMLNIYKFFPDEAKAELFSDIPELPNDMENYMQYHLMGSVSQVRMNPGCIPKKFECQPDRKTNISDDTELPYINIRKKRRTKKCESQSKAGSVATEHCAETASTSSVQHNVEEARVSKMKDKCVQVDLSKPFRSEVYQTELKLGKEIIANVYRYLQKEYKQLKELTGDVYDLSPLANILSRTAAAAGVSEEMVSAVLDEEAKGGSEELPPVKRQKTKHEVLKNQGDYGRCDIKIETGSVGGEPSHNIQQYAEYHIKIEPEPIEETPFIEMQASSGLKMERDPLDPPCSSISQHVTSETTFITVKVEPHEPDPTDTGSDSVTHQGTSGKALITVKCEPGDVEDSKPPSDVTRPHYCQTSHYYRQTDSQD